MLPNLMTRKIIAVFFLQLIAITITYSQNLLFKSGFEQNVKIEHAIPFNGQWYQVISGIDAVTGYQWPNDFPTQDTQDAYWTYKVPDTENLFNYVETRIERTIGHDGDSTNALFMKIKDYDPTNFDNSMQGHVRCEYRLNLDSTINKAYIKYWMKLQPNLYNIMRFGTGRWRMIMEWFEAGKDHADYRWNLSLRTNRQYPDSRSAQWRIVREFIEGPGNPGDFILDTLVNQQKIAPINEWFKIEVFWNQKPDSTGRIWFAINNQEIIDLRGPNMRDSFIQNWQIFKLYTDEPSMDEGDVYQWIDDVEIWDDFPIVTDIDYDDLSMPVSFNLLQNYPNPFNPETIITFSIPSENHVTLTIFNVLGQEIRTLVDQDKPAGTYRINFNASGLSSGIYFFSVKAGDNYYVRKMMLIK